MPTSDVFELRKICFGCTSTGMIRIVAWAESEVYSRAPPKSPVGRVGAVWLPKSPARLS